MDVRELKYLVLPLLIGLSACQAEGTGSSEAPAEGDHVSSQSPEQSVGCLKIDGDAPVEINGVLTKRSAPSGSQGDDPRYVITRYVLVLNQPTCFEGKDEWGQPVSKEPNKELALDFGSYWSESDKNQYINQNVKIKFDKIYVSTTYQWLTPFYGEVGNIN